MNKDVKKEIVVGLSAAVSIQINPIEQLRFSVEKNDAGEVVSYFLNSDVKLLLNAERIRNTLGEDGYLSIIRSINPTKSVYEKGNFTDSQLSELIKSRYLQSPSELNAWVDMLQSKYDELSEASKSLLADMKAKQEEVVEKPVNNSQSD